MHKVLFTAGLSNGETAHEGKGNYKRIDGALSPWQRLSSYVSENKLAITSLSLRTQDGYTWNLPSAGKNPKFKAFGEAPKPERYNFFRRGGADVLMTGGGQLSGYEEYAVIEAIYQEHKLQVWVHNDTFASWSLINREKTSL